MTRSNNGEPARDRNGASDRLPTIAPEHYTTEQAEAAAQFVAARKVPVFGPYEFLMHSPELMTHARAMGDHLRFRSAIGTVLSELAIIITARAWNQDYEWFVHAPIAARMGIRKDIIDAIAHGRKPERLSEDEAIVYDFSTELHANKQVSDATFARAEQRFGRRGVVDLAGINAYYALIAAHLNVARYQPPADAAGLPRLPG